VDARPLKMISGRRRIAWLEIKQYTNSAGKRLAYAASASIDQLWQARKGRGGKVQPKRKVLLGGLEKKQTQKRVSGTLAVGTRLALPDCPASTVPSREKPSGRQGKGVQDRRVVL
jgi:hypothetical protein